MKAQAAEPRRLERDLHDGAQQQLDGLGLELALAEARAEADPPGTREILNRARAELIQAMNELRELARGIQPAALTDRGIAAALEALAARLPLSVTLDVGHGVQLPETVEVAAYDVVAEALTNVVKHARARTRSARLARVHRGVVVEVADDGAGGADPGLGSGLRERVEALGGRMKVRGAPGAGARIRATFPVAAALVPHGRAGAEPARGGR